jgi:hypothetical protein
LNSVLASQLALARRGVDMQLFAVLMNA